MMRRQMSISVLIKVPKLMNWNLMILNLKYCSFTIFLNEFILINSKQDYDAFVESDVNEKLQSEIIKNSIQQIPINEFQFDGICSLLFPKLFPFGSGDPTKKSNLIKDISNMTSCKCLNSKTW